jgi:DNA-binding CsgD family transcriptional regulator/PAS domain-containing protein
MEATKARLERLFVEYERALQAQRFRAGDLELGRLDYHLPLLERLDAVEDSSVVLYDLYQRKYVFLTSSFKFLLGYDRGEALGQGPEYFYRRMPEEDLGTVLDTVTRTLRFLYGLPAGERKDYKLGFDFRIRRADGRLVRLLQQVVVLELDARGNIWLVLAVNDLVEGSVDEEPPRRSLRHLRSGKSYLFVPREPEEPGRPEAGRLGNRGAELTKREIEVLGLVAVGLASREIADQLYISTATVNNHRQRILSKTGARNSSEAVRYAARLGIL